MTKEKKKFITEQKLEFFFNYLHVCMYIHKRIPYTSTLTQKMSSSAHPSHNLIYLCSTHGHKWAVSAQPLLLFSATCWSEKFFFVCQSFSIFSIRHLITQWWPLPFPCLYWLWDSVSSEGPILLLEKATCRYFLCIQWWIVQYLPVNVSIFFPQFSAQQQRTP